jgi:drug/metabolite transporter (DMT)-like permease
MRQRGAGLLSLLPFFLLALAVLFWAGNWVMARALRFDVPPVALAFWRWTIAFVILLPLSAGALRTQWRQVLFAWKPLCLLALLATVLQHIPIYIGLKYTAATNGALLNATSPIFIILLSRIFLGDRLNLQAITGILISFAGVLWVVTRGNITVLTTFNFNVGDLWVLLATLSWAGYTVCLRWRPAKLDPLVFLVSIAAIGVVAMTPLYALEIVSGVTMKVNTASLLGIAYVGMFASVLSYIFWNRGVEQVGPGRAGAFMYLMPVFTATLSMVLLGEALRYYHAIGIVLIFAGIYLSSRTYPAIAPRELNSRSKA